MAVVFFVVIVALSFVLLMLRQRVQWIGRRRANDDAHDCSTASGCSSLALVVVSPAILFFLWMLSLSLKYEIDNGAYPPIFIPERLAWSNYVKVFEENNFLLYLWNSVAGHRHGDAAGAADRRAGRLWHRPAQGREGRRW